MEKIEVIVPGVRCQMPDIGTAIESAADMHRLGRPCRLLVDGKEVPYEVRDDAVAVHCDKMPKAFLRRFRGCNE